TLSYYHIHHILFQSSGYLSKNESDPTMYPVDGSPIRSLADGMHYRTIGVPIKTNYFNYESESTSIRFQGSTGVATVEGVRPGPVLFHQFYLPGWIAWNDRGEALRVEQGEKILLSI